MTAHHTQELVPYTPQQLYDLVLDVVHYPEFIPWCRAARILSQDEQGFIAELMIAFKHVRESYVSRVVGNEQTMSIDVTMIRGPFHHLTNSWQFLPHEHGCLIDFRIDFAFKSSLLEGIIGTLFHRATRRMVAAFKERADALYGQP
ncbi:MAG: type II toxin-antitoxin system RatA family toxin [Alphaproteobacteria bacterium]|nr:MAG: type II toxin-antitoxin system RatA family toxin [Alphaproteobacteria bacterium]TAF75946.1 MAG: type II toxin-antitoxin system RatA family toxin [Alphaproteobacteria bacterium]